jgi:hypothetical protein
MTRLITFRKKPNRQLQIDKYMHGYCMFLAAALHQKYGFPVALLTVRHRGVERLSHAWVVLPNGKHLDIRGEQTLEEMCSYFPSSDPFLYRLYNPTTFAHLEQLSGTKLRPEEEDVLLALSVAHQCLTIPIDGKRR